MKAMSRRTRGSKDAKIRIEEPRGIAEAQKTIYSTLTQNYPQHEAINAQLKLSLIHI